MLISSMVDVSGAEFIPGQTHVCSYIHMLIHRLTICVLAVLS